MPRLAIQDQKSSLSFGSAAKLVVPFAPTDSEWGIMLKTKYGKSGHASNFPRMFSYTLGAEKAGFRAGVNLVSNTVYITTGDGSAFVDAKAIPAIYNQWNTYCFNHDGTTYDIYQNGALAGTNTRAMTLPSSAEFRIGQDSGGTADTFSGGIMSMIVYRATKFTSQEIIDFHARNVVPTGAKVDYRLNEGAGTTAYDSSGNANNGTITNGTWVSDTPTKKRQVVSGNLVYNGDFEYAPPTNVAYASTTGRWIDGSAGGSTTNTLFGWYQWSSIGSTSVIFDSSVKRSGNYSLKLSTTATGSLIEVSNVSGAAAAAMVTAIPIRPSTSYTYSFWMKTNYVSGDATSGATILFKERTAAGSNVQTTTPTKVKTTTDWTQYTGTFTSHATSLYMCPNPMVIGNDGTATLIMDAYFDSIELKPTTPVTRLVASNRLPAVGRIAV